MYGIVWEGATPKKVRTRKRTHNQTMYGFFNLPVIKTTNNWKPMTSFKQQPAMLLDSSSFRPLFRYL